MIFKEKNRIIYCKDKYYKNFDNIRLFHFDDDIQYYKGYIIHREDGPAIEWDEGDEEWIVNGKLHREDGPALTWCNQNKWWLNNKQYSKEEYWNIINLRNKSRILDEI